MLKKCYEKQSIFHETLKNCDILIVKKVERKKKQ